MGLERPDMDAGEAYRQLLKVDLFLTVVDEIAHRRGLHPGDVRSREVVLYVKRRSAVLRQLGLTREVR